MLEPCCRGLRSFGSTMRTTQADVPGLGTQLAESLRDRFGNPTKADYAESQLSSTWQGKNESAHDYFLRFEAVLDKVPVYEQSWVRNIFVWGLHSTIA